MKQKELMQVFEANRLEEVKDLLCLYGSILDVIDWQEQNGDFCREYLVTHCGIKWDIRMKNGEILSAGYNVAQ